MNTSLRITTIAGIMTLAGTGAAGATSLRLAALTPPIVGATTNACLTVSAPATVAQMDAADLPDIAVGQNVSGMTVVRITLDDRGRLVGDGVMTSSNNRWIDEAALHAARSLRYAPEVRDCQNIGGDYALIVDFTQ
jgi:TonB family protein